MGVCRRSEVLRYVGYAGQEMTPELDARVDAVIARVEQEQQARGYFRIYNLGDVEQREGVWGRPVEGTTLFFAGDSIVEYLTGAHACALMVCTCGVQSEQALRSVQRQSMLDGVLYASTLTDMVERGADRIEAEVIAYAHEQGWYTNYRYSPGYGDFDLSIQPEFIRVLDAGKLLGITVTDTNFLVPTKSITAVVGFYREQPPQAKVGCKYCNCREWCTIRARNQVCWSQTRKAHNEAVRKYSSDDIDRSEE